MATLADRDTEREAQFPGGLDSVGIAHAGTIHWNLSIPRLVEIAVERGEGELASNGALTARTGKYTGRSPGDKFVVDRPGYHDRIW